MRSFAAKRNDHDHCKEACRRAAQPRPAGIHAKRHEDVNKLIASAREALAAYDSAQPGFTVCLQEVGDTETTHVTYQACATRDEAVAAAIIACRADWEDAEDDDDPAAPRDLHV